MKSSVLTVLDLFSNKRRYVVPLFQRQYVWSLDKQWVPLWDDIEREVIDRLKWYESGQAGKTKSGSPGEHLPYTLSSEPLFY